MVSGRYAVVLDRDLFEKANHEALEKLSLMKRIEATLKEEGIDKICHVSFYGWRNFRNDLGLSQKDVAHLRDKTMQVAGFKPCQYACHNPQAREEVEASKIDDCYEWTGLRLANAYAYNPEITDEVIIQIMDSIGNADVKRVFQDDFNRHFVRILAAIKYENNEKWRSSFEKSKWREECPYYFRHTNSFENGLALTCQNSCPEPCYEPLQKPIIIEGVGEAKYRFNLPGILLDKINFNRINSI